MRIVIDATPEQFEAANAGKMLDALGPVEVVEIRDGLLSLEVKPCFVNFVSRAAAPEGTAEGGPLIAVYWTAPKEK